MRGVFRDARGDLLIHPYTLRVDDLPPNAPDADAVLDALVVGARVDGLFTDFTDVAIRYRAQHAIRSGD